MKKLFSSILLILALCLAAPTANAQFRWSGTAGVSINNLSFKQDLVSVSQTVGYAAGINGEMMFPGIGMGLSFGLLYNQQGAKVNLGERLVWSSEGYGNEQVFLHTASIPVHLRFKYTRLNGFEDKIAPLVFAGPEFNIQVAHGNCKAFDYSGGDLGVTVGIGAEIFKRWQLTGSYTWGMTYVLKTALLDNYSARSRQWNIRLAYFF
jgi:hypothetical protein